jgi:UDP-3-O-[3-hydroxymyristoyl] glucosamine N-acyltransferase
VGCYAVIGLGSTLAAGVIIDDYCSIENEVRVGERTLLIHRAQICSEAQVGCDCVIGGFVCERASVGDRARVFGKVIHSQHDPSLGWDTPEAVEPSAVIEPDAFVGFGALVIGEVVVGAKAYICAGAIVTRDVPAGHMAYGVNRSVPLSEWRGSLAKCREPLARQVSDKPPRGGSHA